MNRTTWYEKYRPTAFEDLVLPDANTHTILEGFYNDSFIRGNILGHGESGYGKSSVNEVLIHKIVKCRQDIFILDRKASDVDELRRWLQYKPSQSKQKIVKIEEIDKLSQQAQTVLKDGLMEKHQHNCAFLATTNNPEKLDRALLTRFNIKIDFKDLPVPDVFKRLKFILESEGVSFDNAELASFIEESQSHGLREMINIMEMASSSGTFKPIAPSPQKQSVPATIITDPKIVEAEVARLEAKYNKSVLGKAETAKELDISTKTLNRRIASSPIDIPVYKELSNGKIIFPIRAIAEYLTSDLMR